MLSVDGRQSPFPLNYFFEKKTAMKSETVQSKLSQPHPNEIAVLQSKETGSETLPEVEPSRIATASPQQGPSPVPDNVPRRRWMIEIEPKTYYPFYWNYSSWSSKPVEPAPDQSASIDVRFFAELYIVEDLHSKVIRLSTLGNGFSPGTLRKNEWRERGVFQDTCSIAFGPTGKHPLRMGGNSPENQNNVAKYNSATSFQVSGKGGTSKKDGGSGELGGSYSVNNEVSTELKDFQVLNESGSEIVKWSWALTQMGDGNSQYTYPYNGPSSLVTFIGNNICPLPALARGRLFPACQAYWFAPRDFNGEVTFSVTAIQSTSYVVTAIFPDTYIGCIQPSIPTKLTANPTISFDESIWDVKP